MQTLEEMMKEVPEDELRLFLRTLRGVAATRVKNATVRHVIYDLTDAVAGIIISRECVEEEELTIEEADRRLDTAEDAACEICELFKGDESVRVLVDVCIEMVDTVENRYRDAALQRGYKDFSFEGHYIIEKSFKDEGVDAIVTLEHEVK